MWFYPPAHAWWIWFSSGSDSLLPRARKGLDLVRFEAYASARWFLLPSERKRADLVLADVRRGGETWRRLRCAQQWPGGHPTTASPIAGVADADERDTDSFGKTRTIPKKGKPRPLSDGLGFRVIAEATPDKPSGMSATVALASSSFWREFEPSTRVTGYSTARGATSRSRSARIATGAIATARPIAVSNSGCRTSEKR